MGDDLDLWPRIEAFDVDGDARPGYFVEKLAHDHGWTRAFAARVLDEYRRFAYLACTAEHVAVPSEQVDMAWHQHLMDTEQYWSVFCHGVLSRPLHHRPNKGGQAGLVVHAALYERTLRTYALTFGHAAPDDIWPPPSRRFRPCHHAVPNRRIAGLIAIAVALPAVVAWTVPSGLGGSQFGLDILRWSDAEFFAAFATATVVAVMVSLGLRRRFFGPFQAAGSGADVTLDPYDVAVLGVTGGRAVNAAVAGLIRDDALGFDPVALTTEKQKYLLRRTGPLPARAHSLERAVYDVVARADDGLLLSEVHRRTRLDVARVTDTLRDRALLDVGRDRGLRRWATALPIIAVSAVGVTRLATSDTPWTPVLLLLGPVVFLFAVGVASPPKVTAVGRDALAVTRVAHEPGVLVVDREDVADGRTLSWIVALQGATVLTGALSVIGEAIMAPASHGGGGEATGPGSVGCGGCGGGCGGCGG